MSGFVQLHDKVTGQISEWQWTSPDGTDIDDEWAEGPIEMTTHVTTNMYYFFSEHMGEKIVVTLSVQPRRASKGPDARS